MISRMARCAQPITVLAMLGSACEDQGSKLDQQSKLEQQSSLEQQSKTAPKDELPPPCEYVDRTAELTYGGTGFCASVIDNSTEKVVHRECAFNDYDVHLYAKPGQSVTRTEHVEHLYGYARRSDNGGSPSWWWDLTDDAATCIKEWPARAKTLIDVEIGCRPTDAPTVRLERTADAHHSEPYRVPKHTPCRS